MKLLQREHVLKIENLEADNTNLKCAKRSLEEDIDKSGREKQEFTKVTQRGKTASKGPASERPDASTSYLSKNQYEVISDSDQEREAVVSASESVDSTGRTMANQHKDTEKDTSMNCKGGTATNSEAGISKKIPDSTDSNTKTGKHKLNILFIGDSMIIDINPHKLSKSSVRKLTYPGKTAEEIANQVSSAYINAPPTKVIIHAGTNNLTIDSSKDCFDNIQFLSSKIKSMFKDTRVAISSLITRKDTDVSLKIQQTNELLKALRKKEGYAYIENGNIDATCLNGSNLHLNAKGSALLAVHFIKFLRGRHPRSSGMGGFPMELRQLGELLKSLIKPQKSKKRTNG